MTPGQESPSQVLIHSMTPKSTRNEADRVIDETNNRYTRLLVLGPAPPLPGSTHARWHVRCDCGTELEVRGTELRRGATRSCGCLRAEAAAYAGHVRAEKRRAEEAAARAKRPAPLEARPIDPALLEELEQRRREIEACLYLIETADGSQLWVSPTIVDYRRRRNLPVTILREPIASDPGP